MDGIIGFSFNFYQRIIIDLFSDVDIMNGEGIFLYY